MTTEIIEPTPPIAPTLPARRWYEIWWDVWAHPGAASFHRLLAEPNHQASRGFIWIGVTSIILALFTVLVQNVIINQLAKLNTNTTLPLQRLVQINCFSVVCGLLSGVIAGILGLAITSGIYHLIAKIFRGHGNWNNLTFALTAVYAPNMLVGVILLVISAVTAQLPVLLFLPVILGFVIAIYVLILNVNAIRVAEDIGAGQAFATILIPGLVVFVISVCCLLTLIPLYNTSR